MARRVPYKSGMHSGPMSTPSDPNLGEATPDVGEATPPAGEGAPFPGEGTPIGGAEPSRPQAGGLKSLRRTNVRLCRKCGVPLITNAEDKLGIHISCVAEIRFRRKPIPGPAYGRKRQPDR